MLIKLSGLALRLNKPFPAVYVLLGQEPMTLNKLATLIITTWRQDHGEDVELRVLAVNTPSDWLVIEEEANSYSLFSESVIIDLRYDKKTLDAGGKAFLERYLQHSNPKCLILLRAPELPLKQLMAMTNHPLVHVMSITPPKPAEVRQWLTAQMKALNCAGFDPNSPSLIQQYNEGNLLACSQVLEKLALMVEPEKTLTLDEVREQLVNQCDYPLYDLADACLNGDIAKALLLLRQAAGNKTEATLILWLLTQEVRLLMQLLPYAGQTAAFREKANQLKLWANRIPSYQAAIMKYNQNTLFSLLRWCNKLDGDIKTGQNGHVWRSFELIALSLCQGKKIDDVA